MAGALATARIDTSWRLRLVSVALGLLVLMTIWGFGRAVVGDDAATPYFVVGLTAGTAAALVSWTATNRRLARLRRTLTLLTADVECHAATLGCVPMCPGARRRRVAGVTHRRRQSRRG